jgi:hypothetical protein
MDDNGAEDVGADVVGEAADAVTGAADGAVAFAAVVDARGWRVQKKIPKTTKRTAAAIRANGGPEG